MDTVDREMQAAGGPFFLGKELSMVDVVFTPFLERIAASIYYYKGFVVRGEGCAASHALCAQHTTHANYSLMVVCFPKEVSINGPEVVQYVLAQAVGVH